MSSEEKLDHLIRQGQFREAVAYLNAKSALSALDLLSLGRILTMQGKVEEALDVLNRAEAPESNDSFGAELFLARTDAWSRSRQPGAPEQARRCLEKAEGLDSTPRIQGLIALKRGALAIRESDHERAMPLLHTARTLLEDHPNEHVQVLDATGGYWAGLGDAARALAYFNRAILEKKEIEDLYGLAISHGRVGRLHLRLGEPALAEAALTEDLRLCRQMGDERAAALCLNDLARVAIFRGDGNAAMELLTEVAPLVQAGSMGEAFLHKDRAAAALLIDDLALAENALHTSRELFGNSPGDYAEAFLNQVQASLDAKRGQLAQACRGLENVVLTFKRLELRFEQIPALIELSERRLGMEDQQGAADALIEALSIAETARADSWVDRLETQLADVDRSRWLQYVLGKVRGIQSSNRFGYALRSESRFLVTLFSDVVGFTAWSSDRPADEVVNALNEYFCQMAHVIESCGGQIDKYIGDGLMVLFDGDEPPQILATQACTCALGMLDALDALNRDRVVTGRASLAIRIGLNAGEAVVGNMGSYTKVARSAVGREVNLAARLEGLSEPGRVLCSESVRQLADRQQIRFVDRGMVNPKGLESVKSYWVERPT